MRMVDIYELEGHLADVLDQLRETGETVAVTRGDEIIAHLMPTYIPGTYPFQGAPSPFLDNNSL